MKISSIVKERLEQLLLEHRTNHFEGGVEDRLKQDELLAEKIIKLILEELKIINSTSSDKYKTRKRIKKH